MRIDVIAGRLSPKAGQIDVFGTVFFLLPWPRFVYLSWPIFVRTYVHAEISTNAGGLAIWLRALLVPIGFTLLTLQGISSAEAHRIPAGRGRPDHAPVRARRSWSSPRRSARSPR